MRKLYVIRENEEDGRLVAAMKAAGMSTDESEFENPVCPVCNRYTVLAYEEDDECQIVGWDSLADDEYESAAKWFLFCSGVDCTWEEEVTVVKEPEGAIPFDLTHSHMHCDEEYPPNSPLLSDKQHFVEWLREMLETAPNRKYRAFLTDALDEIVYQQRQTRKWIDRVPPGKRVQFSTEDAEITGTFITATETGFLLLKEPGSELVTALADDVHSLQPLRPDRDDLPRPIAEVLKEETAGMHTNEGRKRWIMIHGYREMVVIGGHHLHLYHTDRLGQYHVRSHDAEAAKALGLKKVYETFWEGVFLRKNIESRYDVRQMVKVKGHWLDQYGVSQFENWPAVHTSDPVAASELDLKPDQFPRPYDDEEEDGTPRPAPVRVPRWSGVVPEADVEDRKEVRLYHWPLPEFQLPEAR